MPFFIPEKLSEWARGNWIQAPSDLITGFQIDARRIEVGEMFVALEANRDGHEFLDQALKNGASSALVKKNSSELKIPQLLVEDTLQAFQDIASRHRDSFEGPVIGITGSCGKTSTKEILTLLLGNRTHSTKGNLNNHLGVPLTLLNLDPESSDFAVVEVGINQVGEMENLASILSPNLVLITMIGESHLEGLNNLETVALEKSRLFRDSNNMPKALFHADCLKYRNFREWKDQKNPHLILHRGEPDEGQLSPQRAFYEIWTETNTKGDSCLLRLWRHESPVFSLPIPVVSDGLTANLALAVLAACELGVSFQLISERLPQYRPSTLRGTCFQGRGRTYFVDCYNANPASMKDSMSFFGQKFHGMPKLYVLGGMEELGERGKELHFEVGSSIQTESTDLYVMIGEKASWFADGFAKAGAKDEQLMVLQELESARSLVDDFKGAVLFKGSRTSQLEKLLPSWAVHPVDQGVNSKC